MEQTTSRTAELQPLSIFEMIQIEGGMSIPWGGLGLGIAVSVLVNLPDLIEGAIAGWNAAAHH